jgi:hypothetical protein
MKFLIKILLIFYILLLILTSFISVNASPYNSQVLYLSPLKVGLINGNSGPNPLVTQETTPPTNPRTNIVQPGGEVTQSLDIIDAFVWGSAYNKQ